jgi:small neutral amino acid transporter SnatA (MarC family)
VSAIKASDKLRGDTKQNFHRIATTHSVKIMYRNRSGFSLLDVAMPAVLGAGVITTFAMSQGQHPAIAISITAVSAIFAVICHQFDLI